ncbi:sulfate/molybdate ABC transporter ATP-binding protein [Spongiimicrobium salis]|uniref:sulfate/molybdate ABC transporter ATP-binding protein n=1 Tax=Spongiimicrobium salis TaxID=1667022 RepID=UPI00374CAD06
MIAIDIHKTLQAASGSMKLHVPIEIKAGEFITLYGDSGAGKTSTLRMLAGLLKPDHGSIVVKDRIWFHAEKKINRSPQERKIGFVFQDYALFPNMTVRQNLEFALPQKKDKGIIAEIMDIIALGELQDRKPQTLSGGQQQRVALGRALVQRPSILLLDEPFSALDLQIRKKLQDYLLRVHREFNLTTILISHDIPEIVKLSDRVVVLKNGTITRQGTPTEVFIQKKISGKFSVTGEVLAIEQQDVVYIVTVLVHNTIIKVIADSSEIEGLQLGDSVLVASKAFNPILYKIEQSKK